MKQNSEGDIADRIVKVSESSGGLTCLFYGRPGTGKTNLSATFPKPLLLIDVLQEGTDTIANVPDVDVLKAKKWEDLEEIFHLIDKNAKWRSRYKSIIIDQITECQDLAMKFSLRDAGKDENDTMSKRSWGEVSGQMKTLINNFRSLAAKGKHVAFLAHERENDVDEGSDDDAQIEPNIGPRMMPSVASYLCGAVSVIGNTFIREKFVTTADKKRVRRVDYAMRIGPHAYYTTKVRHPVGVDTPDVVVDPSFETIMAIVKGRYQKPMAKKKVK